MLGKWPWVQRKIRARRPCVFRVFEFEWEKRERRLQRERDPWRSFASSSPWIFMLVKVISSVAVSSCCWALWCLILRCALCLHRVLWMWWISELCGCGGWSMWWMHPGVFKRRLSFHLPWLSNCNLQQWLSFNRNPLSGVSRYDDGTIFCSDIVQWNWFESVPVSITTWNSAAFRLACSLSWLIDCVFDCRSSLDSSARCRRNLTG